MRTNTRESLTIGAIANAAGCSNSCTAADVSPVPAAWRRWRHLQRVRLEAARAEVFRIERGQALVRIVAENGFSNPSRFAKRFRRTDGAYPSEALRAQSEVKSRMPGRFTDLEVREPRLIAPTAWDSLPLREKAVIDRREFVNSREWAPLDRRRFRIEPESYRTQYSIASIGRLRAHRIADSLAMQFTIQLPTADVVRIVVFERGGAQFVLPGRDEPAIVHTLVGATYSDDPGFQAMTSDNNSRLMLTLPAGLLQHKLEALLDGGQVGSIAFEPVFDTTHGAGATISRMLDFLFTELEHPDSLLTNKIAIQSYEEQLALCLLLGLPHSHSERLLLQRTAAAPANVKRAEEFMCANAREPLTIEAIATAAGCSIRALQLAFRSFRGTTPMSALQRVRLEAARAEMLRSEQGQSLARIAAEHGFSNPSRFAQLFRRTFGAYPSEAVRTRRGLLVEQR